MSNSESIKSRVRSKIIREWNRSLLIKECKRIKNLSPLSQGSMNFTLLSMVHRRDVLPYLLAVRSFSSFLNPDKIYMLCDPSITISDRLLVQRQIPHIRFLEAHDFRSALTPSGGCWERINAISHLVSDSYVVQLDADTLTYEFPSEVDHAIQQNRSFVLGESRDGKVIDFFQASSNASAHQSEATHIQHLCEFSLRQLVIKKNLYVRGCAGFSGFTPQKDMREQVTDFSVRMAAIVGDRWREWGTEQVCSNFVVANQNDPVVLPFPSYGNPDEQNGSRIFSHFIGSIRFESNEYSRSARSLIDNLFKTDSATTAN
jgi:hypothetical protein